MIFDDHQVDRDGHAHSGLREIHYKGVEIVIVAWAIVATALAHLFFGRCFWQFWLLATSVTASVYSHFAKGNRFTARRFVMATTHAMWQYRQNHKCQNRWEKEGVIENAFRFAVKVHSISEWGSAVCSYATHRHEMCHPEFSGRNYGENGSVHRKPFGKSASIKAFFNNLASRMDSLFTHHWSKMRSDPGVPRWSSSLPNPPA
ncbi:hypothetical protein CA13_04060 [Planctomycetes bacterium CA13]|uniref:Uncharacterized protein n=1 Tax=Novipirellula herctigrandis TaxID=2527986 RepID=A0A5C5YVC5_9BACT|nr:hypothetical protein CA13_04060 [Planctomycetes bacterium CA13]